MTPQARLQAIAFDFDGVLAESVNVKTEAFRELFAEESPDHLQKILQHHIHNGGISRFQKFRFIYDQILQRPLSEERFQWLGAEFARLVVEKVVASPWVPGATEFLERYAGDYMFFIVSGTPDDEIKRIAERRGIARYFREILGSPRTKEALLTEAIDRNGLDRGGVVYIGDAENDRSAAEAAGVAFIWRQSHEGPALEGYAGPRINSLIELNDCLKNLPTPRITAP